MDYFNPNYITELYLQLNNELYNQVDNQEYIIENYIILSEDIYNTILDNISVNLLLILFTLSCLSSLIFCQKKPITYNYYSLDNKEQEYEYKDKDKDKIEIIKGEVVEKV